MTEDSKQKEIRLRKELAQLRANNANESRKIEKNRDFTGGVTLRDTQHKQRRFFKMFVLENFPNF